MFVIAAKVTIGLKSKTTQVWILDSCSNVVILGKLWTSWCHGFFIYKIGLKRIPSSYSCFEDNICIIFWTVPGAVICKKKFPSQSFQSNLKWVDHLSNIHWASFLMTALWVCRWTKQTGSHPHWPFPLLMWGREKSGSMGHLYGQELSVTFPLDLGESSTESVSWEGSERGARLPGVKLWFLRALTLGDNRILNFLCLHICKMETVVKFVILLNETPNISDL